MKKVVIVALVLLFAGYIVLMAAFEGPIRIENPTGIALNTEEKSIELPWYLRALARYEFTMTSGNLSSFFYSLPDIFESAEIHAIVSWQDETCMLYIGDSRAMEIIRTDFPDADWK